MGIELREVDRDDERQLRAWWEVGHAAEAERPHQPWPAWEQSRVALPRVHPERATTLVTAYDGDAAVGASMLALPTQDNLHLAFVEAWVVPSRRRRGTGRLLAVDLERRARAAGRDTLLAEAKGPDGTPVVGAAFATTLGYELANEEQEKHLDLRTAPLRWGPLDEDVATHLGGYTIETFDTVTPDERIEGVGRLLSDFLSHVPLGEVALEDSEWTPDRLRAHEHHLQAIGRSMIVSIAVAPDGKVAGWSDVRVSRADARVAQVGITLVSPDHRGHRLGLALKLATHRRVMADHPECAGATTCNAVVNTAMNAVNGAMGYVVTERLLELQKRL